MFRKDLFSGLLRVAAMDESGGQHVFLMLPLVLCRQEAEFRHPLVHYLVTSLVTLQEVVMGDEGVDFVFLLLSFHLLHEDVPLENDLPPSPRHGDFSGAIHVGLHW